MKRSSTLWLPMSLGVSLLALAPDAQAYLDPSTGSMILSAIVGIFATVGLAVKTYWYRLKRLFRGQRAAERREDSPKSSEAPSGRPPTSG